MSRGVWRLLVWVWGEAFIHSHRSRRLTRFLYIRLVAARKRARA